MLMLRRFALAIGLLCGVAATQAPEFMQQYRQRLAGAVDELSRMVGVFNDEAARHSLTPSDAIARLMNNSDPLARERGADMASDIERLKRLAAALAAFRDPSFVQRLVAIAGDFDVATARLAWDDFEPAVPTSAGALAIGILGLFGGWAATHLCAWPIRQRLRKRRARRLAEAA